MKTNSYFARPGSLDVVTDTKTRREPLIRGLSRKEGKEVYKLLNNPCGLWNQMVDGSLYDACNALQDIYEIFDIR